MSSRVHARIGKPHSPPVPPRNPEGCGAKAPKRPFNFYIDAPKYLTGRL